MKKIVLVLVVALMGTIVMNAQPPRRSDMSPEQMVEKRVERLDKHLGLTAEQKAAITRIYTEEMQARHNDKSERMDRGEKPDEATMSARHQQMKAQKEATDAKIEALLTPEQATKYAQMKQHAGKRGHDKGRMGHRGHAKKGDRQKGNCENCNCKDK